MNAATMSPSQRSGTPTEADSQASALSDREREAEAFRAQIRAFVRDHIPAVVREKSRLGVSITAEEENAWLKVLGEHGWMVPHWPELWGGTGWPAWKRAIFHDELVLGHAPEVNGITFEMVGPLIARFGTEPQKPRFLRAIPRLQPPWCQGYSDPESGSDPAPPGTRAGTPSTGGGGAKAAGAARIIPGQANRTKLEGTGHRAGDTARRGAKLGVLRRPGGPPRSAGLPLAPATLPNAPPRRSVARAAAR